MAEMVAQYACLPPYPEPRDDVVPIAGRSSPRRPKKKKKLAVSSDEDEWSP